jgi:hypothetical protein
MQDISENETPIKSERFIFRNTSQDCTHWKCSSDYTVRISSEVFTSYGGHTTLLIPHNKQMWTDLFNFSFPQSLSSTNKKKKKKGKKKPFTFWKMLNRPKIVNAISTKRYSCDFFSQSALCPVWFYLHLLGLCYACFGHVMGILGYVTCYWACYVPFGTFITWKVMSAKRAQVSPNCFWVENMNGAKGRLGENFAAVVLLYWLHLQS